MSSLSLGDELIVIASAQVDQNWASQPLNMRPDVPPQAHIVNARINPSWTHENNGKVIQGQLDWFSVPIKILKQNVNATYELSCLMQFQETSPSSAIVNNTTLGSSILPSVSAILNSPHYASSSYVSNKPSAAPLASSVPVSGALFWPSNGPTLPSCPLCSFETLLALTFGILTML